LLYKNKKNEVILVDFKTKSFNKNDNDDLKLQLSCYKYTLENRGFKIDYIRGYSFYDSDWLNLTPYNYNEIEDRFKELANYVNNYSDSYSCKHNAKNCFNCNLFLSNNN
jgi:hypothetical protein